MPYASHFLTFKNSSSLPKLSLCYAPSISTRIKFLPKAPSDTSFSYATTLYAVKPPEPGCSGLEFASVIGLLPLADAGLTFGLEMVLAFASTFLNEATGMPTMSLKTSD